MPTPIVSVRTSVYNHAPYIRECIESVLMQETDFPFEYIIGEDFSTDGSREIVMEYAEKYPHIIRVLTADQNVGGKANGVRCIRSCRGKYIAICEGDDCWTDPGKLKRQVALLEENGSVIMSAENAVVTSRSDRYTFSRRKSGFVSTREIVRFRQFATASIVHRNGPLCEFGITSRFFYGDAPLSIKTSLLGNVHYSAIQSSIYRRHEGGVTALIQGSFRIAKQHMKYTDDLETLVGHRFLRTFNFRRACVYYDLSRHMHSLHKLRSAKVCAAKARSFDCLIGLKYWFKLQFKRVKRRIWVPRSFSEG